MAENVGADNERGNEELSRKASISAESTGGIGTNYEGDAIAIYLAAMLAQSGAPGAVGVIVGLAAQQGSNGRPLDDLLVRSQSDAGEIAMMDLQLKRRLTISAAASNPNFAEIVSGAWDTMELPSFTEGRDRAGGAAEIISVDRYYACEKLGDIARLSSDGKTFAEALDMPGQIGKDAKAVRASVATVLEAHLGHRPGPDQLHRFWRHFIIVRLETTSERSPDRLRAIDQLRGITSAEPDTRPDHLFRLLESLAKSLNVRSTPIDRDQLVKILDERYGIGIEGRTPKFDATVDAARKAAETELTHFQTVSEPKIIEPLFHAVKTQSSESPEQEASIELAAVEAYLRSARMVTIIGDPGSGKSHALSQIALALLETSDMIPVVRSLPALAAKEISIDANICGGGPFDAVTLDGFSELARAGRLVLLLDGWNELNAGQREWAWHQLEELKRSHPSILLILTSRIGTAGPLDDDNILEIRPFARDRQLAVAEQLYGSDGRDILIRARAVGPLRPLLKTPIFLTAILQQGTDGALPSDRESAIAAAVATAGGSQQRRDKLRAVLDGQQQVYLEAIAWTLMEAGTVIVDEQDLLPVIANTSAILKEKGLLVQPVSPQDVLDHLISHHLLVRHGTPDQRTIGLQHQLLQEWFASHRIGKMIEAHRGGLQDTDLVRILDSPFWSVAVMFAADRLARKQDPPCDALSSLVVTMTGIEPFLAAEILHRASEFIGDSLDARISEFAENWALTDEKRAIRFMLATGRPQFGVRLWQALETGGDHVFDIRRSDHQFPTTALEPNWQTNFPKLNAQTRRVLLIDLVEQGDIASLDLATQAAMKDPDSEVVSGVIDYLDFRGERQHLDQLLDGLDRKMWIEIVRRRTPDSLSEKHSAQWISAKKKRFASATGIEWVNLALEFGGPPPGDIVDAALDVEMDSAWANSELHKQLSERYPAEFGATIVERLERGARLPYDAKSHLKNVETDRQDQFLALAKEENGNYHRRELIAVLLVSNSIASLVDEAMAIANDRSDGWQQAMQLYRDILLHVRLELLIDEVVRRTSYNAFEAAALASILSSWRDDEDRRNRFPVSTKVRDRLAVWTHQLLDPMIRESALSRGELAALVSLIGRIGSDSLLPDALRLWDENRQRQAVQRAALSEDLIGGSHSEAHMYYNNAYRDALISIGGNAVIAEMMTRLSDDECEHDAAIVLGQLLKVSAPVHHAIGPAWNDYAARCASLEERRSSPPSPEAAAILDRIDRLVKIGDSSTIARAFQLAGPATVMNYGDRVGSLFKLVEQGRENRSLVDLCKALGENGEALPADIVRQGIDDSVAEVAALGWASENDHWKINAWLRLVAFADDARAALPDIADLPDLSKRPHQIGDLVFALGYSRSKTAVDALSDLAAADSTISTSGRWAAALSQIGTVEAANVLLEGITARQSGEGQRVDGHRLREALVPLIAKHWKVRQRVYDLLREVDDPQILALLSDAFSESLNEDEAKRMLDLVSGPDKAPIARSLVSRLENAAVKRNPVDGASNLYELEAEPLTSFRRHAFNAFLAQGYNAECARASLVAIDHLRDHYGKPLVEPYHPMVESQEPWPVSVQ
ncbi:NACHT domain-containing protein [uncultured Erythrobacter sp.]|uniref:NACHT domain-containing protein n=1 Tax=uncultured Erythrobacter sp. TaxID=263913 RepID=UPI0026177D57|nr:NACHT domain-containing protein [uncultured Erythrobacter sp.]